MKKTFAMATVLGLTAATLSAQDSYKNLRPVYPGGAAAPTNTISTNASNRGLTNGVGTNQVGVGAPGRNGGIDSGEDKGRGLGEAPPVGTAPGPGKAPPVGHAPPIRNTR